MTLRYYLGDLQETYLDFNNECGWTTERRTMMRRTFNHLRRQTFEREDIVCECGWQVELWDEGKPRTRQLPGKDEETFNVLLAYCGPCANAGREPYPEQHQFEEVIE